MRKWQPIGGGSEFLIETRAAWAKRGNKVKRLYRCESGPRKGRIVSSPRKCGEPIDLKKRQQMRKLKAAKGKMMVRKTRRTKRTNPASRRLRALNRRKR